MSIATEMKKVIDAANGGATGTGIAAKVRAFAGAAGGSGDTPATAINFITYTVSENGGEEATVTCDTTYADILSMVQNGDGVVAKIVTDDYVVSTSNLSFTNGGIYIHATVLVSTEVVPVGITHLSNGDISLVIT